MLKDFPWIAQEQQFFGQGNYDFKRMDIRGKKEEIKNLKSTLEEKKKRVNFKVDAMFDDTNSKYEELLKKREILENNKREMFE